jgi:hypothetical protein
MIPASDIKEYESIVEFSYVTKSHSYVIRFLDGTVYNLAVVDLPRKFHANRPRWSEAVLANDKTSLMIPLEKGKKKLDLPCHIVHSKGRPVL